MVFKKYHLHIILRLLLIVANCFAVVYVWQLGMYWISFYNLVALLLLQVYLLFRYLSRWQENVRVFANSVRHGDYTITYHLVDKQDAFYELYEMLNAVSAYVRVLQSQIVEQDQYFKYLVENAQVGLMAYDEKGNVLLANDEVLRLMKITQLKNINQLRTIDNTLFENLTTLLLNQPKLIRSGMDKTVRLSARLSKIVISEKQVFLLSLININPELSENELQSWQDLISVLTHEIMNSVTPIHSLTGSMSKYLDRIHGNEDLVEKAKYSLDVMSRRSQALMHFVDRYRTISTVPLPRIQIVKLKKLISDVLLLMQADLNDVVVDFQGEEVEVQADPSLLDQVVINLLKNAVLALSERSARRIDIRLETDDKFVSVKFADNGKGIPSEVIDKIFIPFFTTRENGSGIGLTLSRQIMHRHNGTIDVESIPGLRTTFTLRLPKPAQ